MANAYIDTDTDTVYVERGDRSYVVVGPDGDPTIIFRLPGAAAELISEDDVDTTEAYNDGYDEGYRDGQYDTEYEYTQADLDTSYDEGYRDGRAEALEEKDTDE